MRRLSNKDFNVYKICDDCDDKLANIKVEQELDGILKAKTGAVELYKVRIEEVMTKVAEHQQEVMQLNKEVDETR